jgi:dipeptidyl-peptidase-4
MKIKMKKIITLSLLLLTFNGIAQNKLFTMDDAIIKGKSALAPFTFKQMSWIKNTNEFSYIDNRNGNEILYKFNAEDEKNSALVNLTELNAALKKTQEDTLKSFPTFTWEDVNSFVFTANKKRWLWITAVKTLEKKMLENLPNDAENIDKDKKKGIIAYTKNNNLLLWNAGKVYPITNDVDENIINGQQVHRNEFGITKGTFWSPSSNFLAFYRMDQRMVKDYPITDYNVRPALAHNIKYPMAGDSSHEVTVGVFDLKNLKTIFIKTTGPADHYLTNLAWSLDEKHLYIAELNREQNEMKLNSYNAQNGDFEKTLFIEKDEKYVEPLNPMIFVANNPSQFIWQSNRDGWNHLYLYNTTGNMLKQLTKGNWEVTNFTGINDKCDLAYYESTAEGAINRDLYSVSLVDGKINKLTENIGTHKISMNNNCTFFIDNFSNTTVPNITTVYNAKGKKIHQLLVSENPLSEYKIGAMNLFTIKNKMGDLLQCRLFKPIDFDSTKTYPVVVYLYGGPHAQMVTNSWLGGANLWFQYMAQKGYIVFTLDNRGSESRGKNFEQATFRQLGKVEMEDQLVGVDYLKSLKYVDGNRLGLHGWSFGGFMTTNIMITYPNIFKVAVAGGPVIDWSYYEIMYTERYMDTPNENKEGYKNNNLVNKVDQLKGKLMLIHGTSDDVVVWQHSLMFVKKAVEKNIPIDYFPYPGHLHNVLGKDRVHLMQKVSNYFFDYL